MQQRSDMGNGADAERERAQSIDTVVRAFTDAELALREITGAIERLRSAADHLDAARADQLAARESITETVSAVQQLGEKIERTTESLANVVDVLRGLEPERLWQHLDQHTESLGAAADRASADVVRAAVETRQRIDDAEASLGARVSEAEAELAKRSDELQGDGRKTRWFVIAVLGVALLNLLFAVLFAVGWAPFA